MPVREYLLKFMILVRFRMEEGIIIGVERNDKR